MTSFHNVTFPMSLAFGASGGPERRTQIVDLASGESIRNAVWSGSRRRYDVGGAIQSLDDLSRLTDFFEARKGPVHSFRFRDPADWRSCGPSATPTPTDQQIGIGDGTATVFGLSKRYGDGEGSYIRSVTKPVSGSVVIAVDGVIDPTATANELTGEVTFTSPPEVDAVISAGFDFDTPCRFATDHLEAVLAGFEAGRILRVPLIEVVNE